MCKLEFCTEFFFLKQGNIANYLRLSFKVRAAVVSWDEFWTPHSCQEKQLAPRMWYEQPICIAAVDLGKGQIEASELESLSQCLGPQEGCRYAACKCTIHSLFGLGRIHLAEPLGWTWLPNTWLGR